VSKRDQEGVVALANHYVLHFRKLLDAVDLEPEFPLLQFEVVSDKSSVSDNANAVTSASDAAQKIRASWQLGDGPISNLVRFVEATGILVVEGDFGQAATRSTTASPRTAPVDACQPRHPQGKGKVERHVRDLRETVDPASRRASARSPAGRRSRSSPASGRWGALRSSASS
jgi:hypothetical protein